MRFSLFLSLILSTSTARAVYGGGALPAPLDQNSPVVSIRQKAGCGDPSDFGYVVPIQENLSWLQLAISQ